MRITSNTIHDSLIPRLQKLDQRQVDLQSQISTGKKVSSTVEAADALPALRDLESSKATSAQYLNNISRHQERAAANQSAINSLKKVLDRAQEIAVLARGVTSAEQKATYTAEINSLISRAVDVSNTKWGDQYLLSGTASNQAPFSLQAGPSGNPASVNFLGNGATIESEIAPGTLVSSQIPSVSDGSGSRALLKDERFGADLFGHLFQLRDALATGQGNDLGTAAENLSRDEDNFLYQITANGALQARLAATATLMNESIDRADAQMSKATDADLAEVLIQLNDTSTAYQAALQSASRSFELSLLDYIR